jgi:Skp family chaperone for outer membrane proteins
MSEAAKTKLQRDYDTNTTELKRASEDYDADVQHEQSKMMGELGQKMMAVLDKYCNQHNVQVLVDVSNPDSGVLWADPTIDVTNDVIKAYDQTYPDTSAPKTSAPAAPATKK